MKSIGFYIAIYIGYNWTDTDKKHTERASHYLTVRPLFTCAAVTLYFNIYHFTISRQSKLNYSYKGNTASGPMCKKAERPAAIPEHPYYELGMRLKNQLSYK